MAEDKNFLLRHTAEEIDHLLDLVAAYTGNPDGLGIRKTYTSIEEMESDTEPTGEDGKPLEFGQMVSIYDPDNEDSEDNGKVYVFLAPGWKLVYRIDASYATRTELEKLQERDVFLTEQEYEALKEKDDDKMYYIYEEE